MHVPEFGYFLFIYNRSSTEILTFSVFISVLSVKTEVYFLNYFIDI